MKRITGTTERRAIVGIASIPVLVLVLYSCAAFRTGNSNISPTTLPRKSISSISDFHKGALLYSNPLGDETDVSTWQMEGPGSLSFSEGWMTMESPDEEYHHVFWCPEEFPSRFIAEWSVQLLEHDLGLIIVFFAAQGLNGEDVLDPSLPSRDGTFNDYIRGELRSYHISYYANAADKPGRLTANLRKNSGFHWVQEGRAGIPIESEEVHRINLVKDDAHVVMFLDGEEIINWTDDEQVGGPFRRDGKMGFRQMQWTKARYRDFTVWALE